MVQPGDIYVALKGATKDGSMVGSVARLPLDLPAGRLTQDTARLDFLRSDPNEAGYLYWLLRSPQYRAYCDGRVTGFASASFGRDDFLSFPVPPMTQWARSLTSAMHACDDKIEQNRRTAEALERLARVIFRTWFVDFEPLKAKAAGATSFPPMPQPVFDSLPTRFVEAEIGPVPAGWGVKPIAGIASFLNGLALQKYPPRGDGRDLRVIKIAELRKGSTEGAGWASADVPEKYLIHDGDLLFSWSGTLEAKLWFGGIGALNQHLFKVTSAHYPSCFACCGFASICHGFVPSRQARQRPWAT